MPAFLLWHILVWPWSVFSLFSITKQQSHITQLNSNLSFLHGVICHGENVSGMDSLHARHLQGTYKKTLQIAFSSLSSRSCLLSANNLAFMREGRELYAGGLGRLGRNFHAPVKPVGNVLLVPGVAVLCHLPMAPKSFFTPSLSNAPTPFGSSSNLKSSWTGAAVLVLAPHSCPRGAPSLQPGLWAACSTRGCLRPWQTWAFFPPELAGSLVLQNAHPLD